MEIVLGYPLFDNITFRSKAVFVIASPPFPVHFTQVGIWALTRETVSITSPSGITGLNPEHAIVAEERAFMAALTFLPRHGTSTRSATGSHTRPIIF